MGENLEKGTWFGGRRKCEVGGRYEVQHDRLRFHPAEDERFGLKKLVDRGVDQELMVRNSHCGASYILGDGLSREVAISVLT